LSFISPPDPSVCGDIVGVGVIDGVGSAGHDDRDWET